MNNFPPINMHWVSAETRDPEDCDLVFTGSQVTLFKVRKLVTNWHWFKRINKVEFMVKTELKNPTSGRPIGGYFNTLEEAQDFAVKTAAVILRGHAEPVNEPDSVEATAEPSPEQKRATERENDASWAANPDRSGGQFTQDEINNTGWH